MPRFIKKEESLEERKKKLKFIRVRGMKDVLPEEYRYFDLVIRKASDLARSYGFKRVDTPVLEKLELFERTTGRTSDIVTKEMYSFVDKGGEKVALRPEATPGIARVYLEHGLFSRPQPFRTFWIGPVFRYERPQAGRYRQHNQLNFDIFGESGPIADVQLIQIAHIFCKELQINNEVQINSIGCAECRKAYLIELENFFKEKRSKSRLCNDCKKRLIKNPLRVLDCKEPDCIENLDEAPQIVDYLCPDCRTHFVSVLEYLDDLSIPYNLNPRLVRGLDYYTRTVFEIISLPNQEDENSQKEEKSLALFGGGRYDKLLEQMGGHPTPACGFAIGVERVFTKIKESGMILKSENEKSVFVAQIGDQARKKAMILFEELRRNGFNLFQSFTKNSLKSQMEDANRENVKITLILGQKEVLDDTILIRDMESGVQEIVDYQKIVKELKKRFE